MEINKAQLERFTELYKNELDISLSPVEAQQKALSLLRFLAISIIPFETDENGDRITKPDLS